MAALLVRVRDRLEEGWVPARFAGETESVWTWSEEITEVLENYGEVLG